MAFESIWRTVREECEALGPDATLVTPATNTRFRISDIQEQRILIDIAGSGTRPLQCDQFEILTERIADADADDGFALERVPPAAEPYVTVLSLHPEYEIDEQAGTVTTTEAGVESDMQAPTQLLDVGADNSLADKHNTEPNVALYTDMLLLVDALEHHDPGRLAEHDTPALVNLYTLLSDVERGASNLRQEVREALLSRVDHDQPVHGQYGSIQRTGRRRRTLKNEEEVLNALEKAGIAREQVLGIDRKKVDEALEATTLQESAVYDIDENAYIRKAEVDETVKKSRLQGLKDQLIATDDEEAEELQAELDSLEARIEELTSFRSGAEVR